VEGTTYWGFPEPGRVASVDPAELGALAQNERKGEYLRALGRAFAEVSTEFLMSAPYEQVDGWLRGIKGVGEWSATFIMLRGLGRTERVPFSEWRLVEAANAVYGRDRKLSRQELEGLAGRYGQWQGYWAHYLRAAGVVG
jgi:DNA-3-methyladenine glycosylase II